MKLNVVAFSIAQTVAAAILYFICSFFVSFFPDTVASPAGYVLHVNLSGFMRPVDLGGFISVCLLFQLAGDFYPSWQRRLQQSGTKSC